ncbi:hypothetical protein D1155_08035 [Anaerotruncus sp. 80]|uniref:Uncharacterized protein n=1 Tax=Anaerotruncus colihominis TaxID=169435 RepID=A0A845QJ34_9FIRM|nr:MULTISPECIES: hypothetical protein [Anaerotruncus]NBH61596.1 hypothetical protein [Anaerotruncus colihominis]NCF02251.1 hypothetical protein [Anaerotruncus sp. 80]
MIDDKYYRYAAEQMERASREKKKYNGYKDKPERICFYTGRPYAERHEVFPGRPNRQISIEYGFQVDICPEKHRELQDNITPWAKAENQKWRSTYERAYIDRLMDEGEREEDALQSWMRLIGRNYIEELIPR